LAFAGVIAFAGVVGAQESLEITGAPQIVEGTASATFGIAMTTTSPVEGFVVAISYDNSAVQITNVTTAGSVTESNGAELIVPEILATGFTLGVVMDAAAPFGGQTIPAGVGQNIASFTAQSILSLPQGDPTVITGFDFVDGVLNNPPLDNILVQGGLSNGSGQGLGLNGASAGMGIEPPPPSTLYINDTSAPSTSGGCVPITLDNDAGATQGFVLSISHDPSVLTLTSINISGTATEAVGAEFVVSDTSPANGGTLGVVLDFVAPFLGQTIPPGLGIHIANYCYNCNDPIIYFTGQPVPPADVTDLTFVDGVFGVPTLDNVVVVGGLSVSPNLSNGQFTCEPVEQPLQDTTWYCGPRDYEGTTIRRTTRRRRPRVARGTRSSCASSTPTRMATTCRVCSWRSASTATCHSRTSTSRTRSSTRSERSS
jgi:hypothetical protein